MSKKFLFIIFLCFLLFQGCTVVHHHHYLLIANASANASSYLNTINTEVYKSALTNSFVICGIDTKANTNIQIISLTKDGSKSITNEHKAIPSNWINEIEIMRKYFPHLPNMPDMPDMPKNTMIKERTEDDRK